MQWIEELPASLKEALQRYGGEGTLSLAVRTDMARDGTFGERWLVATPEHLSVWTPQQGTLEPDLALPLKEVSSFTTDALIGASALQANVNGNVVEVLRYSNAHTKKFSKVAQRLDQMVKAEAIKEEEEEEKPRFCPHCGLLLPDWTSVCPACVSKLKVLRRLLTYVKPYWFWAVLLAVLTLSSTGLGLVPAQLMRFLVDQILVPRAQEKAYLLGWVVLGLLATHLGGALLSMWHGRLAAWLGSRLTHEVRSELYRNVEWQSLRFFDQHQVGAVMSRVTNDTRALQSFLVEGAQIFIINVLTLVGIGVVLFWMQWKLALWILLPAPLIAVLTLWFWRRAFRLWRRQWHFWSKLSAVLNDSLSGIKVVKAFAQEDREIDRFVFRSQQLYLTSMRAEQMWATFFPLLSVITQASTLMVWFIGGRQVLGDQLTLGMLTAFLMYLGMFYGPLQMLTHISDWLSHAFTAAERIFEVLDTQPEVQDAPDAVPMPHIEGRLEFRNVTFGYEKHNPVLKNINLTVEPGEMIGFVGHSGAGKTTMINLICRFYDVDEGALLIDGRDIRKIRYSDLRRQLGVVLQETFLFDGTVAENISYAKPEATLEEIMNAAKAANAHDFIIGLPDGYDTQVGERGQRLSGGERQRIAIARAILHNPRILILDEATSLVDTETEQQIQEALARLVQGRTTFAIAHRLSTLRNAHRLFVLEQGQQAELGTHEELMAKKGTYYKLVEMQTELNRIQAVGG